MDTQPAIRHNLPSQPTSFIGREREIEEIMSLLDDPACRLLTLVGPGGIGKTRLALEIAARKLNGLHHGVFFVPLQPLTSHENIVPTVAVAVGYQFQPDKRDPRQQLLDYFQHKSLLLLMDNFEHLLEGVDVMSNILAAAPEVKIVTTSRAALNLSGEWLYDVQGLGVPFDGYETSDAVQLFLDRAQRVSHRFSLSAHHADVVCICQLVDGMPLAIEIAASWVRTLSCAEIATQIEHDFDILATPLRNVPERHRSMRAVFDWSWSLLTDEERTVFRRLSVFRGGCTREAAQAVTGTELRTLQALVDKSFIRRDTKRGRYDIHELLRQYSEAHLETSGDAKAVRNAHMSYYADTIQAREADLKGHKQLEALDEIEADFENVRVAWWWALQQRHYKAVDSMMEAITRFAEMRSRHQEKAELFTEVIQQLTTESDAMHRRLLAKVQTRRGPLVPLLRHFDGAEVLLRDSLAIAHEYEDRVEEALCLWALSWTIGQQGRLVEALQLAEESLLLFSEINDQWGMAWTHIHINFVAAGLGDVEEAYHHALQAYQLFREIGNKFGMAVALIDLGFAASTRGDWEARDHYQREALALHREIGDASGIAWSLSAVATSAFIQGNFDEAEQLATKCCTLARDINSPVATAAALIVLSEIAGMNSDETEAHQLAQEGYAHALAGGNWYVIARANHQLGWALCMLQVYDAAIGHLSTALEQWLNMGDHPFTLSSVAAFTRILAHQRYSKRAVELLGLVFQHPIQLEWLDKHPRLTELRRDLKTGLGEDAYDAAWEHGKSLNLVTVAQELLAELRLDDEADALEMSFPPHVLAANSALMESLTPRELEILQLIADGLTNRGIADQLIISINTVQTHIQNLYGKLGVSRRAQVIRQAQKLRLV